MEPSGGYICISSRDIHLRKKRWGCRYEMGEGGWRRQKSYIYRHLDWAAQSEDSTEGRRNVKGCVCAWSAPNSAVILNCRSQTGRCWACLRRGRGLFGPWGCGSQMSGLDPEGRKGWSGTNLSLGTGSRSWAGGPACSLWTVPKPTYTNVTKLFFHTVLIESLHVYFTFSPDELKEVPGVFCPYSNMNGCLLK